MPNPERWIWGQQLRSKVKMLAMKEVTPTRRRTKNGTRRELPVTSNQDESSVTSMDGFLSDVSTAEIQREKSRAKELRQSQWWKRKRATGICHYCQSRFPPTELTMDH